MNVKQKPEPPSLVIPLNGDTIYVLSVYLDWTDISGADYYQVQVDNNSSFSSPEIDAQTSSSNYSASGLADLTQYHWRVRAHNSCGWGNWNSGNQDFTTDIGSAIEEIQSGNLPDLFSLSQNYPNPFNPETQIEFSLPKTSFVTIDIFNILGTRIRNLVTEQLSAGYYTITWNSRGDSGQPVSSGVYLYRLQAGDYTETKKMLLLK